MNVADATREVVSHFPYRKKGPLGFFKNWVHPLRGLRSTWELESSLKVELAAVPVALALGRIFKLSFRSRLKLLGLVFGVILVELLNTSTEELVRDNHPRRSPHFRRAMDASAAAVLVAVGIAAIGAAYIVWDDVSGRYAAMSDGDLDLIHVELITKIEKVSSTRLGLGRNITAKLWLKLRLANYNARLALVEATIEAREGT